MRHFIVEIETYDLKRSAPEDHLIHLNANNQEDAEIEAAAIAIGELGNPYRVVVRHVTDMTAVEAV